MRLTGDIRFPDPLVVASTISGVVARSKHDISDAPDIGASRIADWSDPSILRVEEFLKQSSEKNLFR